MKYIDLSHNFTADMPMFPGDPKPEIKQITNLHEHDFVDFQITTSMHIGTHIDAPMHIIPGGKKISEYPIERFFGRGVLVNAKGLGVINADLLDDKEINKGDIVLFYTGCCHNFRFSSYYTEYPLMTTECAKKLVSLGVKIVGIDSPSPDSDLFEIHKELLGNNILLIENLANLDKLLGTESFEIISLPAPFDAEAAPVRVVAKVS